MQRTAASILAVCLLGACSYDGTQRQAAVPPMTTAAPHTSAVYYRDPAVVAPVPRGAATTVNVVGTPFYALFKAVACVGTVAIAGPTAGLVELTARPDKAQMQRSLGAGVAHNCGGSYVLRY
jgi:hypothetical protein